MVYQIGRQQQRPIQRVNGYLLTGFGAVLNEVEKGGNPKDGSRVFVGP